ncbi:MAG: hypothetical protein HKM95_14105 [Inquilinus sp.]|nr:hypothetical protein [Inquilinus sp.]
MPFSLYLAIAILLVLSHAVPSAPRIRACLVGHLGRKGFLVVYSLVSLAVLAAFVHGYRTVDSAGWLFEPPLSAREAAVLLMPVAILLVVGRLTTRAGSTGEARRPTGIYRISRYPGSTGLLLWASLHLLATGDVRRLVLFAAMAAIALSAIVKNEMVLRRSGAATARDFLIGTSILPGIAIARGRQKWPRGEIGWWRPTLAAAIYAAILWAHPMLFGVDPAPWLR